MDVLAIISEYNPFHLGHKLHLEKSLNLSKATHSVAIMSSSFVQRGEPAILDKWKRAKMAIQGGFDLVIELPVVFSLQSAELFAYGAIKILESTNSIDYISFGSEEGNIDNLYNIANLLIEEPNNYKNILLNNLKKGLSFPQAREVAIENTLGSKSANILSMSNNILGIEYLKALIKLKSKIKPITIKRVGSNYNDDTLSCDISSATAIRNNLLSEGINSIKNHVPSSTYNILRNSSYYNKSDNYLELLNYKLLMLDNSFYNKYLDLNNDLLNRFINSKVFYESFNDMVNTLSTKNYTQSRIKRSLFHILLDLNKKDIFSFINSGDSYIRILASNSKGFEIINRIKNNSNSIIITNFNKSYPTNVGLVDKMLKYEINATNLYNLVLKNKVINEDFTQPIYICK